VKIGRAEDVESRIADLQTSNHERLHVLRVIDTYYETEFAFHARFADLRIHGEWFQFDPEMLTYIPEPPEKIGRRRNYHVSRKASLDEAFVLVEKAYRSYRAFESRGAFIKRLARFLGVSERRARSLMYGEARRVDAEELVDLRNLVERLKNEANTPDAAPFDAMEGR
jgi:hypothetical protein